MSPLYLNHNITERFHNVRADIGADKLPPQVWCKGGRIEVRITSPDINDTLTLVGHPATWVRLIHAVQSAIQAERGQLDCDPAVAACERPAYGPVGEAVCDGEG